MPEASVSQAQAVQNANMLARNLIVTRAVRRMQQIHSETVDPTSKTVIAVTPRNVGLLLGFYVEVSGIATVTTNNYLRSPFGPANVLRQIKFDDLSNNTRIKTNGWHLNMINSAKRKAPWMAARTNTNYPIAYGDTFGQNASAGGNLASNIIRANATLTTANDIDGVQMLYYVPLAYSELDLRGAVFGGVVNATMQLELTLATSAQAFVANAADNLDAIYAADATGAGGIWAAGSSVTVKVFQIYYDQLPIDKNGQPILPMLDLSTIYELKDTTLSGIVANTEFPIPYANFRNFLSTVMVFNNQTGGALPTAGSDITSLALESANFTNIFKHSAKYSGVAARLDIGDDYPTGVYYLPTRDKPISTIQYGNMQLVLVASTVNAGANVRMGYESFALSNTLVGASSLAGGGA